MSATEKVQFEVALGTRQFDTGMTKMRGQLSGMAGSSGKLSESLGKAATATSGLGSAMGGASGQAGALVGATDNLAQAFMIGGPLALGIAAAATGVGILATKWMDAKKAAEESAAAQAKEVSDLIEKISKDTDAKRGQIQSVLGLSDADVAFETLKQRAGDAEAALVSLREGGLAAIVYETESASSAQAVYNMRLAEAEDRWFDAQAALSEAEEAARENAKVTGVLTALQGRLKTATEGTTVAIHGQGRALATATDEMTAHVEAWQREQDRILSSFNSAPEIEMPSFEDQLFGIDVEGATTAFNKGQEAKRAAAQQTFDLLRELHALEADMRRERKLEEEAFYDDVTDRALRFGFAVGGVAVGSVNSLTKAVIEGKAHQKEAWQEIGAKALSEVGGILVGQGTAWGFEGAALLIKSGGANPQGWALAGLGASAVAAGFGMGAGGMALSHVAAGGTIGKALPDPNSGADSLRGGGRDGVGPRSSSSLARAEQSVAHYHFHGDVVGDFNDAARRTARLQRHAGQELLLEGRR